jgi:hypothetical protein
MSLPFPRSDAESAFAHILSRLGASEKQVPAERLMSVSI